MRESQRVSKSMVLVAVFSVGCWAELIEIESEGSETGTGTSESGSATGDGEASGDGDGDGSVCGDGIREGNEACDLGSNPAPTSGCTSGCQIPRSCLEIRDAFGLDVVQDLAAGAEYLIAPRDGVTTWPALCDMTKAHAGSQGGWTGIRLQDICDPTDPLFGETSNLERKVEIIEKAAMFDIDDKCRPFTLDDGGEGHTYAVDIIFPPEFEAMFVSGYAIRANVQEFGFFDQTSEINAMEFVQSEWESAYGNDYGDVSFGSSDEQGPAMSLAGTGVSGMWEDGEIYDFDDMSIVDLKMSASVLRIGWGEGGADGEGWYPWWDGVIYVR